MLKHDQDFLCISKTLVKTTENLVVKKIGKVPTSTGKPGYLEKWEKFFQPGKSQQILKFQQKVREKSGNFSQGKIWEYWIKKW